MALHAVHPCSTRRANFTQVVAVVCAARDFNGYRVGTPATDRHAHTGQTNASYANSKFVIGLRTPLVGIEVFFIGLRTSFIKKRLTRPKIPIIIIIIEKRGSLVNPKRISFVLSVYYLLFI